MSKNRIYFLILFACCLLGRSPAAGADILYLTDGSSLKGEVVEEKSGSVIFQQDEIMGYSFKPRKIARADIVRIESGGETETQEQLPENQVSNAVQNEEPFSYEIIRQASDSQTVMPSHFTRLDSGEIHTIPVVQIRDLDVVFSGRYTTEDFKNSIKQIVGDMIEADSEVDEIRIHCYDKAFGIDDSLKVAEAFWGVGGEMGSVSPEAASEDDRSRHEIYYPLLRIPPADLSKHQKLILFTLEKAIEGNPGASLQILLDDVAAKFDVTPEELLLLRETKAARDEWEEEFMERLREL